MVSNSLAISSLNKRSIIFDILSLAVITVTPALSHMFSVPIYLIEPMRIMLLLTLIHTSNKNAYLMAFFLPLFSYFISSHPVILKVALIAGELIFNVWFFLFLNKFVKNHFITMAASILVSKFLYYSAKFSVISFGLLSTELFSTPIYIQVILVLVVSVYAHFMLKRSV